MTKRTAQELRDLADTRYISGAPGGITPEGSDRPQHNDVADSEANHLDITTAAAFDGQGVVADKVNGLVIPGSPPFLEVGDAVTTAATAPLNTLVRVDAGAASITITAPANPRVNDRFGVKRVDESAEFFITVDGSGADQVESVYGGIGLQDSVAVRGLGAVAWWQWSGTAWAVVGASKIAGYSELWQATPITDVGVGVDVQWTLAPLYTGQVPTLITDVGGQLTNPLGVSLNMQLVAEFDMNILTNNADTGIVLDPELGLGTGSFLFPRIATAFGHSRAATYPMSGNSSGVWNPADVDETMSVIATATNAGGATTDLTGAILVVDLAT